MLVSYAGGVAGRGTPNNPGPVQINGSASLSMGASATGAAVNALTWTSNLPDPLDVTPNGFFDLAPYFTGAPGNITASPGLPANVSVINSPTWRVYASSAATNGSSVSGVSFTLVPDAVADFLARASDPGVMWYHNFDSASEVNQFRWTSGYSGGNDPLAVGSSQAANCAWVSSGGADGGGYLRIFRPSGANGPTADGVNWWRPFTPLTGASNGRGVNDPCGSGAYNLRPDGSTITPQIYSPSDGSATTYNWQDSHPGAGAGWYGHSTYAAGNPAFDGTDFYYQVRVKVDPNRSVAGNAQVGKLISHTTLKNSYTPQELVTYSLKSSSSGAGVPNVHWMYDGTYDPMDGHSTGIKNPSNWAYSFGWDTLLYHVTPGRAGIANDCRLEVWAAHEGETSYTKIWDITFATGFASAGGGYGTGFQNGWCALLCWIYQNNVQFAGSFYQSYDQIIFSKSFIACPQV